MIILSCMHAKSLPSCPTLCNPMSCSPPGSLAHGISQARILEWVAMPSSRESSRPRDLMSYVSCIWQGGSLLRAPPRKHIIPYTPSNFCSSLNPKAKVMLHDVPEETFDMMNPRKLESDLCSCPKSTPFLLQPRCPRGQKEFNWFHVNAIHHLH